MHPQEPWNLIVTRKLDLIIGRFVFLFFDCFAVGISLRSIKLFVIEIFKRCATDQFVAVDFSNLNCFAVFKVARRCWSGNIHAKKAICKAMEENPLLNVTIPCHVQDITLLDKALKPWRALFDCMCETVYTKGRQASLTSRTRKRKQCILSKTSRDLTIRQRRRPRRWKTDFASF